MSRVNSSSNGIYTLLNPAVSRDTVGNKQIRLLLKNCVPQKGPTLEQFLKSCSLREGPTLKESMKDCIPWELEQEAG